MSVTITLTDGEASLIAMALAGKRECDLLQADHADGMRQPSLAFTFRTQAEMADRLIKRMAEADNE